ncbi:MAG: DUF3142 domain-containing protein [Myxococcales bacterium]|nr:DUF3142 domain-containing protein [Myxococcales bacterium]
MRLGLAIIAAIGVAVVIGSGRSPAPPRARATPLEHDAYVWQRRWTGAVRAAVAGAPAELDALRVLTVEVEADRAVWPEVDVAALVASARPVTAVVRIAGARLPEQVPMAAVLARVEAWRAAGVAVAGVEIDHDCASAALPAYARWLAANRPPAPLRFSITALPAWADCRAVAAVAAAVDEVVVQVHTVRAPVLFDLPAARSALARFAAVVPAASLRVALPTYDAMIDGALARSRPTEVAAFVRWLERGGGPPVRGVVWFRLPVEGDARAWPTATLVAVIRAAPLRAEVAADVIATGPGRFDLVLRNAGNVPAPWPALALGGGVDGAELIGGYVARADRRFSPPARDLAPGATTVVGWATGKDLTLDAL